MLGIGKIITFWLYDIDRNILKASDHKALQIVPQLYQASDILEVEVPKYQVSDCCLILFTLCIITKRNPSISQLSKKNISRLIF